jgi:peptidoglycan hydrolase-like protein with peptidoglycan-binding domain
LLQADKVGYLDEVPDSIVATSSVSQDITVVAVQYKISGTVTAGNQPVGGAFVFAEKLGGGFVSGQTNPDGSYELWVTEGDWKVSASADGYQSNTSNQIASVSGGNVSGINFELTSTVSLGKPKAEGITPVSGGTFNNPDVEFEMSVPPSALGTGSSSYQVQDKETSNIPHFSPTSEVIGEIAEDVLAVDPNSIPVTTLNDEVSLDKVYTKTELAQAGIDTVAEIEQVKMAAFDQTAQNWVNLPTTITYLDSNEQPVVPTADLSNVDKVVFNGVTTHFSTVAVVNASPDALAPASPTNIEVDNTQEIGDLVISWTAPTTNRDGSALTDLRGYNIYRAESSSGPWVKINNSLIPSTQTSYTDSAVLAGHTYYYRVTADTGLESQFSQTGSGVATLAGGSSGGYIPTPTTEEEEVTEEAPKEVTEEQVPEEKPITEMTIEELQQKIAEIQAKIAQLQAQLQELLGVTKIEGIPSGFRFEKNLKYQMIDPDVKYLQIVLNSDSETRLAQTGPGSPGNETEYFGPRTKAAVIKFQEKWAEEILSPWNLTKGTGYVGKTTREKLNELLGG